jgi:hypothetical protein
MVFPHRRALRTGRLPFRYADAIYLRNVAISRSWAVNGNKVMAGGTPANPATLVLLNVRGKTLEVRLE